jgi:DNA-binding transcriptional regulator YiaG
MTEANREGVSKPPLDFQKIEALREYTKLTKSEFASLCGVSRMTYYGWISGQQLRPKNDRFVRRMVRALLELVREQKWPEDGIEHLSSDERMTRLNKLLADEV